MPRETPRRNRTGASRAAAPASKVPGWVWLFTGGVLGAFIMFLVQLAEVPERNEGAATASTKVQEQPEARKQPRFDFYQVLKETEVPVVTDSPTTTSRPAPEDHSQYILQVASFKKADDADQLRAELILLNLDAHVETARVRNGETWHRVLVGPFTSRSQLAKARSILVSNRLEALVLKRDPNKG